MLKQTALHELHAEQRWSNILAQQSKETAWPQRLDDKLVHLVTNATASGDRFPVGVNWLDISRIIGFSPVECVKRYAFLHECRGGALSPEHKQAIPLQSPNILHGTHVHVHPQEESQRTQFSGLSSSEDLSSPHSQEFLEYGSPVISPRLGSLNNSSDFSTGLGSPGSPPPFAVRQPFSSRNMNTTVSSPFRWESIAKETYAAPPVLKSPPHMMRKQALQQPVTTGVSADSNHHSPNILSPRIIHGTQSHSKFTDPSYAADIINHAFKGLRVEETLSPSVAPSLKRELSNTDFPFLQEQDKKSEGEARTNPPDRSLDLFGQHTAVVGEAFHDDTPFTASLTQSAFEEAFLDMAGSRLDASNVMLGSRFAGAQARLIPTANERKSRPAIQ